MEKKDRDRIEKYIRNNHESETAAEMAENLGLKESQIRMVLDRLCLKAISPANKRKGIIFPTQRISWSQHLKEAEGAERIREYDRLTNQRKTVRAPGVYNQNGSPYGIATELLGINIKR